MIALGGVGIYRAVESLFWNQGCNIGMDGFTFFFSFCPLSCHFCLPLRWNRERYYWLYRVRSDYSNIFPQSEIREMR